MLAEGHISRWKTGCGCGCGCKGSVHMYASPHNKLSCMHAMRHARRGCRKGEPTNSQIREAAPRTMLILDIQLRLLIRMANLPRRMRPPVWPAHASRGIYRGPGNRVLVHIDRERGLDLARDTGTWAGIDVAIWLLLVWARREAW